jgi:hypothetical protein
MSSLVNEFTSILTSDRPVTVTASVTANRIRWATREDLMAMLQLGVVQPPGRPPA